MTISDGYGEPAPEEGVNLADFHKWLHHMAGAYLPKNSPEHDDLVNEGRIAMWRAMETHDPTKGSLVSWITEAAKLRMRALAHGKGQPTGHEAMRGSKPVIETPLEPMLTGPDGAVSDEMEAAFLGVDALAETELAYHHGEVAEAIAALPPAQREYVFLRFWAGLEPMAASPEMRRLKAQFPVLKKTYLWAGSTHVVGARERLRESLAHLVEV